MENEIKTMELKLAELIKSEAKTQERIDDYQGYIKSFARLKDNLYEEWCNIREQIRDTNEKIILSKLICKKGDRYNVVNFPGFNEIKIERIEVEHWKHSNNVVRFYLRGKFKLTNKWRDIDSMTLEEVQSIITEKITK
jgi:hypothetical protein